MKCTYLHQRAFAKNEEHPLSNLYCPDCKSWLSGTESANVILRLLRRGANVFTSEEQHRLEKEPPGG